MTAPIDPFPDFVTNTVPDVDKFDARMKALFDALDKSKIGLDASSFKAGAFTAAKFPTRQAWQTVALIPPIFTPAVLSYYKDQLGWVRFRPELFTTSAALTSGTALAIMPAGYRPAVTEYINLWNVGVNTPAWAQVAPGGGVTFINGTASLDAAGAHAFYGRYRAA